MLDEEGEDLRAISWAAENEVNASESNKRCAPIFTLILCLLPPKNAAETDHTRCLLGKG